MPLIITTIFVVVAITLTLFRGEYLDALLFGLFTGSFLVYSVSKYYGVDNETLYFWPFISLSILYFIYIILGFTRKRTQKSVHYNFLHDDRPFLMGPTSMGRTSSHLNTIYHPLKLAKEGHIVHYVNLTREGKKLSSLINNDKSLIKKTNLVVYHDKEKLQLIIEELSSLIKNRMILMMLVEDDESIELLSKIYIVYEEANDNQYLFESLCNLINEYTDVLENLKITFVVSTENVLSSEKLFS